LPPDLETLLDYLEPEQIDNYLFIGRSPKWPARVFGGQVLAQSLNAALRTVDPERSPHSMHAYFLRPGDPSRQIVYEVDPIRDGRSFTTRRVVAKQAGRAIFNTSVSFHIPEPGLSHQSEKPDVPGPEGLETDFDFYTRMAVEHPGKYPQPRSQAIDRRPVGRRNHLDPQPQAPEQHMWFRVAGDLGDDPARHQTLLAYISDFALLGATLLPHPYTGQSRNMQVASLDHALWFHRPFRADEFLLYSMDSPSAAAGRGLARGSFYTRDGVLVASAAQEALIRRRDASDE
jgi:acyl-CoA thioesterase-2